MQGIMNSGSCSAEPSDPRPDPRQAKYELAERLVDNVRYGEAARILEALGDYGDSKTLLEQVRTYQAYQDEEEAKLKAERKRQAEERARKEARDNKRWRIIYIALAVTVVIGILILNRIV